jgi:hypothetical protein
MVVNQGGPLLTAPRIVSVFFPDDALAPDLTAFTSALGSSSYWKEVVGEYGVGPSVAEAPIQLSETAPSSISLEGIQAWLRQKLEDGASGWILPDADESLFVLYYPATTSVTLNGLESCSTFNGFHNEVSLSNGKAISFAVVPRCTSLADVHGLDALTVAASHEIIEAVTDPLPQSHPAFAAAPEEFIWTYVTGGGEVGDLCASQSGMHLRPSSLPYEVQRTWSNVRAAAGHDPCVPSPASEVYFNSAPVLPDRLAVQDKTTTTKGIRIAAGQQKTIEIDLYSDAPSPSAWTVKAEDMAALAGKSPELAFRFDRTSGVNGDKLALTVTVLKQSSIGEIFVLTSTLGDQFTRWFVGVDG